MGDVVKLHRGRTIKGKSLPKPIECKECGDDIETARVQAMTGDNIMIPRRCFACQTAWDRRFEREMQGIRDNQTIQIIR